MGFDPAEYVAKKGKSISNDALALSSRVMKTYIAEGSNSKGFENIGRMFTNFLVWLEEQGHAVNNIPPSAFEDYLADDYAEMSPATRDTYRGYFRAVANRVTADMGFDLSHISIYPLEARPTKPTTRGGRVDKKEAKKQVVRDRKFGERVEAALELTALGQPLRNVIIGVPPPGYVPMTQTVPLTAFKKTAFEEDEETITGADDIGENDVMDAVSLSDLSHAQRPKEEAETAKTKSRSTAASELVASAPSTETEPAPPQDPHAPPENEMANDGTNQPAPVAPQPAVMQFVMAPQKNQAQKPIVAAVNAPGAVILNVNGAQFRGPFTSIYRVMDGMIPGTMHGQEVIVETAVTASIRNHGTAEAYLQRVTLERLRSQGQIPPGTAVVSFVLVELNGAKQPTNVRAEVTVGNTSMQPAQTTLPNGTVILQQPYADPYGANMPQPSQQNSVSQQLEAQAGKSLLEQLTRQAEVAREREEKAREDAKKASDASTALMLQQMVDSSRRDREDMEQRIRDLVASNKAPPAHGLGLPMMPPPPPPPEANIAEILKAQSESQSKLFEILASKSEPAPATDPMAMMTPILTMMQAQAQAQAAQSQETMKMFLTMQQTQASQAQAQAAENQKLMLQMQQQQQAAAQAASTQLITILTTKKEDNEFDKLMKTMMLKKFTDEESSIDKLAKNAMALRNAGEALGMGGNGGGGFLTELMQNLPGIMGGAAKMQQAAALNKQATSRVQPQAPAPRPPAPKPAAPAATKPAAAKSDASKSEAIVAQTVPQPPLPIPEGGEVVESSAQVELPSNQPVASANPHVEVPEVLRSATQALVLAAKDEGDDTELAFTNALQNYVMALAMQSGEEGAQRSQVLLTEFQKSAVYEDIYNVAKFMVLFGGIVIPREDLYALTDMLHIHYTQIFATLTGGQTKVMEDQDRWDEDEDEEGEGEVDGAAA